MTIDKPTSDALHRALLRSTTLVDEGRMEIDRSELRRLCEAATPVTDDMIHRYDHGGGRVMLKGAVEIEFSEAQLREMVGRYLQIHGGVVFDECRVTAVERVAIEMMGQTLVPISYRFVVILDPPEEQPVPDVPVPGTWNRIVGPGEEPRR